MKIGQFDIAFHSTSLTAALVHEKDHTCFVYSSGDVPDIYDTVSFTLQQRVGPSCVYLYASDTDVYLIGRGTTSEYPEVQQVAIASVLTPSKSNKKARRVDFALQNLGMVVDALEASGRRFESPFVHGTATVEIPQMGNAQLTVVAQCYKLWFGDHAMERLQWELGNVQWSDMTNKDLQHWTSMLYVLWQQAHATLMKRNRAL